MFLLRPTMAALLLLWTSLLIGRSLQVSLILNPDQSQFFQGSSLLMRCSDVGSSVWMQSSRGSRGRCDEAWGMLSGPYCRVSFLKLRDTGQYWCESAVGTFSEHIDIMVIDRGVVLQAPVHPVTPGRPVSLTCRRRSDYVPPAARFYRDGHFLSEQPKGLLTLQQVAPSDEGQYKCEIEGERSVATRLRVLPVKTTPSTTPPPTTATPGFLRLAFQVVASVLGLVLLLHLVLVAFLVRCCRCKKTKERDPSQPDPTLTSRVCYRPDTDRDLRRIDPTVTSEVCYHDVTDVQEADRSVTTVQTLRNRHRNISPDQDFTAFRPGLNLD